jgi:inner membrane protein YidH
MIQGYSDYAANERTFLACVRTGVAVIAFGFVIEKFNIFVLSLLDAASLDPMQRLQLERLSGPSTHFQGLALIVVGIVLLVVATIRFVRTERLLAEPTAHPISGTRIGVLLSAALVVIVAGLGVLLALAG